MGEEVGDLVGLAMGVVDGVKDGEVLGIGGLWSGCSRG